MPKTVDWDSLDPLLRQAEDLSAYLCDPDEEDPRPREDVMCGAIECLLALGRMSVALAYEAAETAEAALASQERFQATIHKMAQARAHRVATPTEEVRAREALSKISSMLGAWDRAGRPEMQADLNAREMQRIIEEATHGG